MANRTKKNTPFFGALTGNVNTVLPVWDETQIQQENWGGSLGLPAHTPGAVVEFRNTEGKIVVPPDDWQCEAFKETIKFVSSTNNNNNNNSSSSGSIQTRSGTMKDIVVEWKRPVDIFTPFRPTVHRNMTPFLNPYDTEREIFNSKAVEEAAKVTSAPTGKKNDSKSFVPPVPIHIQFPEIVQNLKSNEIENATKEWSSLPDTKVIEKYRELQPLMQAYDPTLKYGCAPTPAEASEESYSTKLRHRLKEVEELSKLSEPPPFVMDAFNCAIRFIEHAQSVIKKGEYLWELIYPHAPGTSHPVYNPYGKYAVRLFIDGAFRRVMIDDYLPIDALGRPFLTITSQKEIWSALLAKAIFNALGSSRHLLFTDPETIITCLRGEWAPQRINSRNHPATACALLLEYRKELPNSEAFSAHFSPPASDINEFVGNQETLSSKQEGNIEMEKVAEIEPSTSPTEKTLLVKENQSNSPIEEGIIDENLLTPPIVCAVGNLTNGKKKLFVIHEIVLFRNTLALQISTNPPSTLIEAKELTLESEDNDIQDLLRFSPYSKIERKISGSVSLQSSFWVTFEELIKNLDLIVWHQLGEESPFRFSNRFVAVDETSSIASNSRKKGPVSTAPSSPIKRNTIRWIHITSDKSEQLVLASLSANSIPINTPQVTLKSRPHSASTGSRPLSAQSTSRSADSKSIKEEFKDVNIELYTWDRGDVLSNVGTFTYEPGKLQCMLYTLPPGSHILRLTAIGLDSQHPLAILSTKEIIMGDEREVLRSANIFKMTDAGVHIGIEKPNEEIIWFKRQFTVKEPTKISFVISTLESGEDPAVHRDIPISFQKEVKTTRGRVISTKTTSKEFLEESAQCNSEIPIISFCKILLMDLDTGIIRTGAVGRLVNQLIEPNQHGFLVMAYAMIDITSASLISENNNNNNNNNNINNISSENPTIPNESPESSNLDEKDNNFIREKSPPLCGKGLWKLTLSSDRMLDSYKQIPQNILSFIEKGQLKRGSNALLFSYTCTIVDKTSFTLLLDIDAKDPIPFYIKVIRLGSVEIPPIFISETCNSHLFISHVILELGDKVKTAAYAIEAWLDEKKVQEWEERRRLAQEVKFRTLRVDAEEKAIKKRQQEIEEYISDPRAFTERLEQQTILQPEQLTTQSSKEIPSAPSRKGRSNIDKRKPTGNMNSVERTGYNSPSLAQSPNPSTLYLDSTDEGLNVSFDLRIHFSSKVDVKNSAPAKDPLLTLRSMWVPPIDNGNSEQNSSSHASRVSNIKGKQKDTTLSMEEILKADQGRLSRQRFLDNPRNILMPYLPSTDEGNIILTQVKELTRGGTGEKEKGTGTGGILKEIPTSPADAPRVITEIEDEVNYLHAPILNESQYRIQLLPLRAVEIIPPTHQSPPNSSQGMLQQRIKSPNDRISSRVGAVSPSNVIPPVVMDEDVDVAELKGMIHEISNKLSEDIKRKHEKRTESREAMKEIVKNFWESRRTDTTVISLIGAREDETTKRRKSRLKTMN